jgi:hypothetical protein
MDNPWTSFRSLRGYWRIGSFTKSVVY